MFTKQGRTSQLKALKSWFAGSSVTWNAWYIHLVTANESELETITYSTANMFPKQQAASSASNIFTNNVAEESGVPTLKANQVTWTNNTGMSQTVYGWMTFFYDGTENICLNYKRFPSSIVVANGATMQFTPGYDEITT